MSKKQPRRPGIHLHKMDSLGSPKPFYYWQLIASNGLEIARSIRPYTRKRNAVNSIRVAADVFRFEFDGKYYENGEVKSIVKRRVKA